MNWKKRITRFAFFIIGLTVSGSAVSDFFGPGNFDECITDSMKGVTSDLAARAIYQSCRNQFPEETAQNSDVNAGRKKFGDSFIGTSLRVDLSSSIGLDAVRKIEFVDFPDTYPNNNRFSHGSSPRFMNRNQFAVGGIILGVTGVSEGAGCPGTIDEYKFVLHCSGTISANSADSVFCDKWNGGFCVIGFWTSDKFEYQDQVDDFVRQFLQ